MRQSACLVFNPIMVDNYAAFFDCTPVGRASDSMMATIYLNITKTRPCNIQKNILVVQMKNFTGKKKYFSYFCSKHRLWVHVRTASARLGGCNEYPQSMFWSKNKKIDIPLHTPVFLYKYGV